MKIDITKVVPNPEQPRKDIDPAYIDELADSIRQHGLINPICVEAVDDHYILIDGECRWRAVQLAGLSKIEASIRPGMNGGGGQNRLVMAIVGNIQRRAMNPIDQACAYKKLVDMGKSIDAIAQLVGLHTSTITRYLSMLDMPVEVQSLYQSGRLKNETNGLVALQSILDRSLQIKVAQMAAKSELSGPQLARLIKRMKFKSTKRSHTKIERPQYDDCHWNMITQANLDIDEMTPEMKAAAEETCKDCLLYDVASNSTCRDCPGVSLLKLLCEVKQ